MTFFFEILASGGTSLSSHQKFKTHKLRHFPRIEVKGGRRAQIISNDFTEKLHHNFETGSWRPDGRAALLGQQIAINALTIYLSLGWHGRFSLILRNDTNKKKTRTFWALEHTHTNLGYLLGTEQHNAAGTGREVVTSTFFEISFKVAELALAEFCCWRRENCVTLGCVREGELIFFL